ncbi:hypothetical protein GCM10010377_48380 [Streptomyces viridiviolaceus]|uniref:Uncharacterized protein n=1 Tax=Streptomyces viridiviolaceus TaxID=68282 RepID=A0ABW2E765_9ACTN|nr:hypothetical protein [Streptomyces viridiviolaceus]GHB51659.1 hypothetical protein GCM10010377_48380 [Streptomyces viridiviolaceus]
MNGVDPRWKAGSSQRRGFEWNPTLRAAYLPFPVTPISAPGNEGDGLLLGLAAGAAVGDMTAVWGVPVKSPCRRSGTTACRRASWGTWN